MAARHGRASVSHRHRHHVAARTERTGPPRRSRHRSPDLGPAQGGHPPTGPPPAAGHQRSEPPWCVVVLGGVVRCSTPRSSRPVGSRYRGRPRDAGPGVAAAGLASHPPLLDVERRAAAARGIERLPWVRRPRSGGMARRRAHRGHRARARRRHEDGRREVGDAQLGREGAGLSPPAARAHRLDRPAAARRARKHARSGDQGSGCGWRPHCPRRSRRRSRPSPSNPGGGCSCAMTTPIVVDIGDADQLSRQVRGRQCHSGGRDLARRRRHRRQRPGRPERDRSRDGVCLTCINAPPYGGATLLYL